LLLLGMQLQQQPATWRYWSTLAAAAVSLLGAAIRLTATYLPM